MPAPGRGVSPLLKAGEHLREGGDTLTGSASNGGEAAGGREGERWE